MEKVGYDPDLVSVSFEEDRLGVDEAAGEDGTLIGRRVSANYDLAVDTFFMPLIGIDTLGTTNAGTAEQKVQNVEISLVVDISGSMNGTRLADLKTSAKDLLQVGHRKPAAKPATPKVSCPCRSFPTTTQLWLMRN